MNMNLDTNGLILTLYSCGPAQIVGIPATLVTGVMGLTAPIFKAFGQLKIRRLEAKIHKETNNPLNDWQKTEELDQKLILVKKTRKEAWEVKDYFRNCGFFILSMIPVGGAILARKIGVCPSMFKNG
ncbi:hypothetical protein PHSC3_001584 [Chlamydiales bacterium STE3]|nr:hypothetical protein PHSC3_001584 [Chlamydiales bacterium STE3]